MYYVLCLSHYMSVTWVMETSTLNDCCRLKVSHKKSGSCSNSGVKHSIRREDTDGDLKCNVQDCQYVAGFSQTHLPSISIPCLSWCFSPSLSLSLSHQSQFDTLMNVSPQWSLGKWSRCRKPLCREQGSCRPFLGEGGGKTPAYQYGGC